MRQSSVQYFLGIDLHRDFAYWTVKDGPGTMVSQGEVAVQEETTRQAVAELRNLGGNALQAVLEPVCAWKKYLAWLEEEGVQTKVVAPLKVKAMAWNKLKNDRVDSAILCDLLRLGFVPEATIPTPLQSELSRTMVFRTFLIRQRAKLKQKMREILLEENVMISRRNIFGKKAAKELGEISLSPARLVLRNTILALGTALTKEIRALDRHLETSYSHLEEVRILRSVPGIGPVTSLVLMATVGDWSRFSSPEELASFAGLVPSSHDSGARIRRGHITKRGSRLLRAALYEATLTVNPSWGQLHKFFERVRQKKGTRSARVALARKLLTICWYLIRKREEFSIEKQKRPDLEFMLAPQRAEAVRIE